MRKDLEKYKPLVDFLADFLGNNTEVTLQDVRPGQRGVIAIRNGHVSGRTVGGPITDHGLNMIKDESWKNHPYRANYKGISHNGNVTRSATYFITDDDNELIGMLCINMDCQQYVDVRELMDHLINVEPLDHEDDYHIETFSMDVKELVSNNIRRIHSSPLTTLKQLGRREKINIVESLNEMGTFMVKGTIWEVAELLGVSVPTVYRYLATIKKEKQ